MSTGVSTFSLRSSGSRLRFGAHMPTSGGLHKSVIGGYGIGCDTVQLFTASPRQWSAPPLKSESVRAFRRAVEKTGLHPLVAHDSYLINLATQDPALLEKSRQAFKREMERAEALGLDYLVTHMGAHTGAGAEAGLAQLARSLTWLHRELPDVRVRVALETTAGQGTALGGEFEHFAQILSQVEEPERIAACLDTCHIFVAGYDIRTPETVRATLESFDKNVGIERLCCIHANDTDKKLGSHSDRHAHIGDGEIGYDGFRAFFDRLQSYPTLRDGLPVIVETPETETMVAENVHRIKRLGHA